MKSISFLAVLLALLAIGEGADVARFSRPIKSHVVISRAFDEFDVIYTSSGGSAIVGKSVELEIEEVAQTGSGTTCNVGGLAVSKPIEVTNSQGVARFNSAFISCTVQNCPRTFVNGGGDTLPCKYRLKVKGTTTVSSTFQFTFNENQVTGITFTRSPNAPVHYSQALSTLVSVQVQGSTVQTIDFTNAVNAALRPTIDFSFEDIPIGVDVPLGGSANNFDNNFVVNAPSALSLLSFTGGARDIRIRASASVEGVADRLTNAFVVMGIPNKFVVEGVPLSVSFGKNLPIMYIRMVDAAGNTIKQLANSRTTAPKFSVSFESTRVTVNPSAVTGVAQINANTFSAKNSPGNQHILISALQAGGSITPYMHPIYVSGVQVPITKYISIYDRTLDINPELGQFTFDFVVQNQFSSTSLSTLILRNGVRSGYNCAFNADGYTGGTDTKKILCKPIGGSAKRALRVLQVEAIASGRSSLIVSNMAITPSTGVTATGFGGPQASAVINLDFSNMFQMS